MKRATHGTPWDERVLAAHPVSVDTRTIEENLALSPDERLDRNRKVLELLARRAGIVPTDVRALVHALEEVDHVIIGALAMVLHGCARITEDLDITYARDEANLEQLVRALAPFHPRVRGAPKEIPLPWDAALLASGMNFLLDLDVGALDLVGDLTGVGGYDDLDTVSMTIDGVKVKVISLEALARSKRFTGRAKDLFDLAEIHELVRLTKR